MADEKTNAAGPVGGSNIPPPRPTPSPDSPEPEARIVEEIIVKPASKTLPKIAPAAKKEEVQSKTPDPAPKISTAPIPTLTQGPVPEKAPVSGPAHPEETKLAPPLENAQSVEPPFIQTPPKPQGGVIFPTLAPTSVPELKEIKIPERILPSPTPVTLPINSEIPQKSSAQTETTTGTAGGKDEEIISRIIQEAKIPERRPPSGQAMGSKEPRMIDTALGATIEQPKEQPQTPAPAQAPSPSGQSDSLPLSPLRTLKNDVQGVIREKKISFVRAVALEQEKRGKAADPRLEIARIRSRRTLGTVFTAVLLVVLGGAAFLGVSLVMQERSGPAESTTSDSILFAESSIVLPLGSESPLDLKRLIAQARTKGTGTLGSITRIKPTVSEASADGTTLERLATTEEFLKALGTNPPSDLLRALGSQFFFGLHTVDENAPVFVIPVVSYERAFAGMLSWEDTMNADLAPVFTPVTVQAVGPGGLPVKRRFEDVVMRNYDVRALKDDRGEVQLYYSFPSRSFLVIAESPYSFTEISTRLRAERKL